MKTNGNDSAQPLTMPILEGLLLLKKMKTINPIGLTKREHFAAMAMQGFIAARFYTPNEVNRGGCVDFAEAALNCADALINALNKE